MKEIRRGVIQRLKAFHMSERQISLLDLKIFTDYMLSESNKALSQNNLPQLVKLLSLLSFILGQKTQSLNASWKVLTQDLKKKNFPEDFTMQLEAWKHHSDHLLDWVLKKQVFKKDQIGQQHFINCLNGLQQVQRLEMRYFDILKSIRMKYMTLADEGS